MILLRQQLQKATKPTLFQCLSDNMKVNLCNELCTILYIHLFDYFITYLQK